MNKTIVRLYVYHARNLKCIWILKRLTGFKESRPTNLFYFTCTLFLNSPQVAVKSLATIRGGDVTRIRKTHSTIGFYFKVNATTLAIYSAYKYQSIALSERFP